MQIDILFITLMLLSSAAFFIGRQRASKIVQGQIQSLHSLPSFYGFFAAIWSGLPAILLLAAWVVFEPAIITNIVIANLPEHITSLGQSHVNLVVNDIHNLTLGNLTATEPSAEIIAAADQYKSLQATSHMLLTIISLLLVFGFGLVSVRKIHPQLRARNVVEQVIKVFLFLCACIAILSTLGIVMSVLFESIRFFKMIPIDDFLFGLTWSPQTAMREDQVGSSGAFGAIPLFTGTLLISFIAMMVAVPVGLMSAIYLSEYASTKVRGIAKPLLEVLAGIPTVVYGFFAALTVAPLLRGVGISLGLDIASESALAAGLVMGIMIIPLVSSLSDDVINAVPQAMRDGAYGLGATKSETIRKVIFPAALPGIVGGILLAVSRALGETMIVVMAAGLAANLTANPLDAVTTVTVQIVTLLTGDQEFDSAKTLAAFALGLVLFVITLLLNVIALRVVRKYREQYE